VEQTVRNIHEVLKQKEEECAQLRHEIEALRVVAPLLDENAGGQRVLSRQETIETPEPSMRAAEGREGLHSEPEPGEIDADRKGPLSSSFNNSSWWKRAK
jgi:hypothetical protein